MDNRILSINSQGFEIGPVRLQIASMERSITFYEGELGFVVLSRSPDPVVLGAEDGRPLVLLSEMPEAEARSTATTGLYHFAILLPERADLGRCFKNLLDRGVPLQGAADHLVSEAIYLPDPDGNGIELYADRPRNEWQFQNGGLQMATLPLDAEGLLREGKGTSNWSVFPAGTKMGHMHLQVSHLKPAEAFYEEVIGFDLMVRLEPSAAFYSVNGYHHHLGINTWAGEGAPMPPANAVGLRYYLLTIPETEAFDNLTKRLSNADVVIENTAGAYFVRDPSHNGILICQEFNEDRVAFADEAAQRI